MNPEQRKNFDRLLNPRHIAFVGGQDAITGITEARRRGFVGEIWAVHPKRTDLAGVPCVRALSDLPEAPDATYLAIPAQSVVATVSELARMGAGGVVCYSAGFKEAGHCEAETALKQATGDMALIGPNCYGFINYLGNTALWSFEHGGSSPGYGAAIITQSGMFSSDITMSQRSLPMAYMISAGNQAVLALEDFVDALCEDPSVRAIGLHIEGLRDVRRFEQAALKALRHNTPVVALKTGTSSIGSSLTVSHTGSLSGSNELYEALFERTGVISVTNPSQMLETLKYLCVVGAPRGRRVAGFTCSGGGATMLADHGEKIGLKFPAITENSELELAKLLPDIATVSNPLDYTTPIWGQGELTYPVFSSAMSAVRPDATILVQDYPAEGLDDAKIYYQNDADAFARAAAEQEIPAAICATIPENLDTETREALIASRVAPMQGIHEALNALSDAARWSENRERIRATSPAPLAEAGQAGRAETVPENEGKVWIQKAGLQVPKGLTVGSEMALEAAREIQFPAALKMMSPLLAHKSEAGAVALSLETPDALVQAIEQMQRRVAAHYPAAVTDNFLIEEMSAPPLAELIISLRFDAQFGAALTIGSGGILVELVGDAKTLLLPCNAREISQALEQLKVGRLLAGYRGRPAANLSMIADQIMTLCDHFLMGRDELVEVEINPMFVYPESIVAVDVLLSRHGDGR